MSKKVSVVIPSRKERWLQQTIDDLTQHAEEEIEIIAHLDGYWHDPPLREQKNLITIHSTENVGMRAGINLGVAAATGAYILKTDGHCSWAQGWDVALKANCDDDWVVVPRRYALDVETWTIKTDRRPVDYHYLSYPFEKPDEPDCGLHGNRWDARAKERKDITLDDEMSSQGSAYFTTKKFWEKTIGPLDDVSYGTFSNEFQEVGNRAWLSGGAVKVLKTTHYSHLFKGSRYGTNYQFTNKQWDEWGKQRHRGAAHAIRFWMLDEWKERKRDLKWLIEKFSPVPGWPEDLDAAFRYAREILTGNAVPVGVVSQPSDNTLRTSSFDR